MSRLYVGTNCGVLWELNCTINRTLDSSSTGDGVASRWRVLFHDPQRSLSALLMMTLGTHNVAVVGTGTGEVLIVPLERRSSVAQVVAWKAHDPYSNVP